MSARKAGFDATSSAATPAALATDQIASPVETPTAVPIPASRPPEIVLRIVSAVSGPGVQMTTTASPTNASRSAIAPS